MRKAKKSVDRQRKAKSAVDRMIGFQGNRPHHDAALPDISTDLARVFHLLKGKTKVDFTHYKHATVQRRIKRRMALHRLDELAEYVKFLHKDGNELGYLYEDLLINVTSFFRDRQTFEVIKKSILPRLLKKKPPDSTIRVWVPGCSSGEETYSLAICLLEVLSELNVQHPIQIFATDLSESALNKGRLGFYPESIKAEVSSDRLRRFFVRVDGGYQIARVVRDLCVFAKHDVTRDPPFSRMELISCRNLLIYLGPILQKKVMNVFAYSLNPNNFLVLGSSESIGTGVNLFSLADKKHKIYMRKSSINRTHLDVSSQIAALPKIDLGSTSSAVKTKYGYPDLQNEIHRTLLKKYNPVCVIINHDWHIVQFIGKTSPYLEHIPGKANLNLFDMTKGGLQIELRALLRRAKTSSMPVVKTDLLFGDDDSSKRVNISISPMALAGGARHYIVHFDEVERTSPPSDFPTQRTDKKEVKKRPESQTVSRLKEELLTTAEYLKSSLREVESTNEELQSANEEILSSNEELQSTNEELETAKEELQSSNEELTTVNEELSTRNSQLSKLNDDLRNLLANVSIPIVMVSNDLTIRRFTPLSEKLLNLIPSDVGRPITDIKPNFDIPNLGELILDTVENIRTQQFEISDSTSHKYSLRIKPYKTSENKVDGAVMIFIDIDMINK